MALVEANRRRNGVMAAMAASAAKMAVDYVKRNPKKAANQAAKAASAATKMVRKLRTSGKKSQSYKAQESMVVAPVATARQQRFRVPRTKCAMNHSNSEFITTIAASATPNGFSTIQILVNPGFGDVFPWLSQEALRWQQYRFTKLRFRFVTRQSTSTAGSIIMAPVYNVLELPPTTEVLATNTANAVEDVVWKDVICNVDCSSGHAFGQRKMVRDSSVAEDVEDRKSVV